MVLDLLFHSAVWRKFSKYTVFSIHIKTLNGGKLTMTINKNYYNFSSLKCGCCNSPLQKCIVCVWSQNLRYQIAKKKSPCERKECVTYCNTVHRWNWIVWKRKKKTPNGKWIHCFFSCFEFARQQRGTEYLVGTSVIINYSCVLRGRNTMATTK